MKINNKVIVLSATMGLCLSLGMSANAFDLFVPMDSGTQNSVAVSNDVSNGENQYNPSVKVDFYDGTARCDYDTIAPSNSGNNHYNTTFGNNGTCKNITSIQATAQEVNGTNIWGITTIKQVVDFSTYSNVNVNIMMNLKPVFNQNGKVTPGSIKIVVNDVNF